MSEIKSDILKFRVTPSFKEEIKELKEKTPGCMNMELQQFIVRLIELGLDVEKKSSDLKNNHTQKREEKIS